VVFQLARVRAKPREGLMHGGKFRQAGDFLLWRSFPRPS